MEHKSISVTVETKELLDRLSVEHKKPITQLVAEMATMYSESKIEQDLREVREFAIVGRVISRLSRVFSAKLCEVVCAELKDLREHMEEEIKQATKPWRQREDADDIEELTAECKECSKLFECHIGTPNAVGCILREREPNGGAM